MARLIFKAQGLCQESRGDLGDSQEGQEEWGGFRIPSVRQDMDREEALPTALTMERSTPVMGHLARLYHSYRCLEDLEAQAGRKLTMVERLLPESLGQGVEAPF